MSHHSSDRRENRASAMCLMHHKRTVFKAKGGAESIGYAPRRRHATGWVVHGGDSSLYPMSPTLYQLVEGRPFRLERVRVLDSYVPTR
jgi:hypothetical protein